MEKEKITECMVCGKLFPRGPNDMARHTNAVTLMHLVSEDPDEKGFDFGCKKCKLYFTSQEHLEAHQTFSSCNKSRKVLPTPGTQTPKVISHPTIIAKKPPQIKKKAVVEEEIFEDDGEIRTLECMICGKLFPRGPIDLARHSQAVTLRHLVAHSRSSLYCFGCDKCDCYFTSEDHLISHKVNSTCNPNMIWPTNADVTAGLRTVPKPKGYNAETTIVNASPALKSTSAASAAKIVANSVKAAKAAANRNSTLNSEFLYDDNSENVEEEEEEEDGHDDDDEEYTDKYVTKQASRGILLASKDTTNGIVANAVRQRKQSSSGGSTTSATSTTSNCYVNNNKLPSSPTTSHKGRPPLGSASTAGTRLLTRTRERAGSAESTSSLTAAATAPPRSHTKKRAASITAETSPPLKVIKTKNVKHIVPEERKAYFAIVSLLIAGGGLNVDMTQITEDNYEDYIPEEHRDLISKLQGVLHYTI